MREWFLGSELIEIDGLANTTTGSSQKAKRNKWLTRKSAGNGRAFEYHISSFHPDIKKHVIEKYVTDPNEAKLLLALQELTEDIAQETSNVSKVIPMTEVKDWCELPVFDVHTAAEAGSLVHSEYQIEQLIIPTSLLAEFGLPQANASWLILANSNTR